MFQREAAVAAILGILLAFSSCSKSDADPQIFLPRVWGPGGTDIGEARARYCDPARVSLREQFLTRENFSAIFRCANYDRSLDGLQPLFESADFPEFLRSANLVLRSESTRNLRDSLREWLEEGPQGTSRADRLLPFVASLVKNPAFQDALPVLSHILQAGREIWNELLPRLADVFYTDLFPDNLENAFVLVRSFSGEGAGKPDEDYATGIKDLARFLKSEVEGRTASLYSLELADSLRDLQPPGTSLHQFLERMLEFGTVSDYFLDAGSVRGEVVDPKLNGVPDPPSEACSGLNDTPEQRRQCAYERMFRRAPEGGDAPLTQLGGLVVEMQQAHPDLLPSLARWFAGNGPRVATALRGYVVRAQLMASLGKLKAPNVGAFLRDYAIKAGLDPAAEVDSVQLAELARNAFASSDFRDWFAKLVPVVSKTAFGERNAAYLEGAGIEAEVAALYQSPELGQLARKIMQHPVPEATMPLEKALTKLSILHRREAFLVAFDGKTQGIEKHLADFWEKAVRDRLGEDFVLDYVVTLAQNLVTQLAIEFRDRKQPLAEWYFSSPYGNPGTTETMVGYAVRELDLLSRYYQNRDWLLHGFADEAFSDEGDRRAFRLLVEQVPNLVLYVRSGMSRAGGDLTRALAKDRDGYLVRTYVNVIVKATETGLVRRGVRLIEAFQQRSGRPRRASPSPPRDDLGERRDLKLGVEALERILRSLVQPGRRDDYETTTLSRLLVPLSSIVREDRRGDTERLLLTSADELLGLRDEQINEFMRSLHEARPPGTPGERRESYRALADLMRHPAYPDMIRHLGGLFADNAVKPALDFLARKTDDGTLPRALLFLRRVLGFGR